MEICTVYHGYGMVRRKILISNRVLLNLWLGTMRAPHGPAELKEPGIIIGIGGTFLPTDPKPTFTVPYDTSPPTPIQTWGLDLSSSRFTAGLTPWPPNPPIVEDQAALSELGHFADTIYNLGPISLSSYRDMMEEFAEVAFPKKIAHGLKLGLARYLGEEQDGEDWEGRKMIWQTDKDFELKDSEEVQSWRKGDVSREGWDWELITDKGADAWVQKTLGNTRIQELWKALPSGILVRHYSPLVVANLNSALMRCDTWCYSLKVEYTPTQTLIFSNLPQYGVEIRNCFGKVWDG
jgi:hypothetical protein